MTGLQTGPCQMAGMGSGIVKLEEKIDRSAELGEGLHMENYILEDFKNAPPA